MILKIILPEFAVAWGVLSMILPSPICSKDNNTPDLKSEILIIKN